MRTLISLFAMLAAAHAATLSFEIVGDDPGAWPQLLSSLGLTEGPASAAKTNCIVVVPNGATAPDVNWKQRVEDGTILVLVGDSGLAQSFGFRPSAAHVMVRSVE